MKLSVVILNYNVRYFLELCLLSVRAATKHIDAEIIVVDNNSSDDSCKMVNDKFPEVILIKNDHNLGFSRGNNIGVKKATGEYVCILNPDTVVPEDAFSKLLNFAKDKERLGAIGCRLIDGSGNYLPESKRNIPYANVALKKLLGNTEDYYVNKINEHDSGKADILVGAFMFLKRSIYNELHGFDEDYFMYGEDIDLSYRLIKAGYKNYYIGNVVCIHFKGESTLFDKNYAKRFYGAMQVFYKKHLKKSLLFDMLVKFGIKVAYVFRSKKKGSIQKPEAYIFISKYNNDKGKMESILGKPIIVKEAVDIVPANTELIYDNNSLIFKDIISSFQGFDKSLNVSFKILPKGSNFLIGSNNTVSRGEVIIL